MILISVDFPAPFSPSSAWIEPFSSVRETRSNAFTPGKSLLTPRASKTASPISDPLEAAGHLDLAPAIDAHRPQDQPAEHDLDEEGIDVEQDEGLRDDGHDRDAEDRGGDADMTAGEDRAADDRGGEGEDEPGVADRRLPD